MFRIATALAATLIAAAPTFAQSSQSAGKAPAAITANTEGEVRKVDKAAGKLTLKHGPIVNLEMPAMTMVFRVKDPTMLDKVQAGDNVRFKAEKIDGTITVTEIQAAK